MTLNESECEDARTLATLRDTLLPKLLSGRLSLLIGNNPESQEKSIRAVR